MDESALRKALASLDVCSSSQHWWLGFWTFLVVAGVTLEIVFVVWEYVEDLHECRRSLLYPPLKPNLLLFILGLFGAVLVAVGVAGELHVESKIATAETCIREGNDALSLLLSKEAGDAKDSALVAAKAAIVAQEAAWPRKVDVKELAKGLRKFAGTPVAFITMGDTEPSILRGMLFNALTKPDEAGWKNVGGGTLTGDTMGFDELATPGICIEVTGMYPEENGGNGVIKHSVQERAMRLAELRKAANALSSALNGQSVAARVCPPPPNRGMNNRVDVFIGPKPLPKIPEDLRELVAPH